MSIAKYPRLLVAPKRSFFLFGMRGTGKSSWTKNQTGTAHRIDLLDEARYQTLLRQPELFAAEIAARRESTIVVDEIQRLPQLLNEVHRSIENSGKRFVLLGSSARKLKQSGVNLLAGRAVVRHLFPFVPEELGADFSLKRVLETGALPLVWQAADRADTLRAYVQMYLKEEIKAEALVRNLPGFARFLPIAALCHAQIINTAGIARDAETARMTVNGYLEILEDTLLAYRMAAYAPRLKVRERRHPKLYWMDPGLVRAVKGQLGPVTLEEQGALFEGWMATLLRAYQAYRGLYDEIHYWSPVSGQGEVDFVLTRGREIFAIEVKSSTRFNATMLVGLKAIADLPRLKRRMLVYRGEQDLRFDGIEVISLATFLRLLATKKL